MSQPETAAAADYLLGLEPVRVFLEQLTGQKVTHRQASYLIESGTIPSGKLGGRILASRSAIRAVFETASTEPVGPRELIAARKSLSAGLPERAADALICAACGRPFQRQPKGRPPKRCPKCRSGGAP